MLSDNQKALTKELFLVWLHDTKVELREFVSKKPVNSEIITRFLIMVEGYSTGLNKSLSLIELDKEIREYKGI